jgi:hypothetical protein
MRQERLSPRRQGVQPILGPCRGQFVPRDTGSGPHRGIPINTMIKPNKPTKQLKAAPTLTKLDAIRVAQTQPDLHGVKTESVMWRDLGRYCVVTARKKPCAKSR